MNIEFSSSLNIIIFNKDEYFIAQCVEYNISACANSIYDVQYAFYCALIGNLVCCNYNNITPFFALNYTAENKKFQKIFFDSKLGEDIVEIEWPRFALPERAFDLKYIGEYALKILNGKIKCFVFSKKIT